MTELDVEIVLQRAREFDRAKKGCKSAEYKIFSLLLYQLSYLAVNRL